MVTYPRMILAQMPRNYAACNPTYGLSLPDIEYSEGC